MEIRPIRHESINASVAALVSAFAVDPLMEFLFGSNEDRAKHTGEFFRILLEARLSLAMPAYLGRRNMERSSVLRWDMT